MDRPVDAEHNPSEPTVASQDGIIVHKILECLATAEMEDQALLNRLALDCQLRPDHTRFSQLKQQALRCMQDETIATVFTLNDQQQAYNEIAIAHNQSVHVIDRLIVDREQAWIIDFKTQQQVDLNNIEHECEKFSDQLERYRAAVRSLYPTLSIRCSLVFTSIPLLIDVAG